jgi:hypothetical protein
LPNSDSPAVGAVSGLEPAGASLATADAEEAGEAGADAAEADAEEEAGVAGADADGEAGAEGEAGADEGADGLPEGERPPNNPSGCPGAGDFASPPGCAEAAGAGTPEGAEEAGDSRVRVATEPAESRAGEAAGAGGQVSDGGRYDASARVRGRLPAACRPPLPRFIGRGAPIALISSGTWLGSTTYTISRRRPGQARVINPAITASVPRMNSAQVVVLSQRGRTSAVVCSCRPGWAAGFMMTRL